MHGLDTDERVCFYEQEFYVLSNFSAFTMRWKLLRFDTAEAVYHWEKFEPRNDWRDGDRAVVAEDVRLAISAHEAFKIAQRHSELRRPDWDAVKVSDRELVENSWRDSFWGWGPDRRGKNMLGKLWMEIRAELRAAAP